MSKFPRNRDVPRLFSHNDFINEGKEDFLFVVKIIRVQEIIHNPVSKRGDIYALGDHILIVCEQLGRKCRIMEYDPKFADVIIDRWEKFTGGKAVKMQDGGCYG